MVGGGGTAGGYDCECFVIEGYIALIELLAFAIFFFFTVFSSVVPIR